MESRADWETENRKALEAIRFDLCALAGRFIAAETSRPSSFGPYVDAVARKGLFLDILAETARAETKIGALKASIVGGCPQTHSLPSYCQCLAG